MTDNLGKGLQSLIPPKQRKQDSGSFNAKKELDDKSQAVLSISIDKIKPNPRQPRKNFAESKLKQLANSIKEHGILQPLVVSKKGDTYQLVAGQRRLRASKIAGLSEVPVIIKQASDQQNLELALVENIQRDNLNAIEKAYAYEKLIDDFNFTQQDVARRIGKSRETVTNSLRLLKLPAEVQRAISENKISEGHGRVILTLPNSDKQILLLNKILKGKLSVRQAENLVSKFTKGLSKKTKSKSRKNPHLKSLENKLSEELNTRVKLTQKGKKGKIIITFFSKQELNNIVNKISKK